MKEQWRVIDGGHYAVSDHGRIRREMTGANTYTGRVRKPVVGTIGYPTVRLRLDGKTLRTFYVHRLVAEAFLGPCPLGREVNHRDGDKTNNHVSNLEYVTSSENLRHAHRNGLRQTYLPNNKGEDNPQAKLTEANVRAIRSAVADGSRRADVAAENGVSLSTVDMIIQGVRWRHVT